MCESRDCESYAYMNLKNCPSDIKQRMANGLCLKVSSLSDACGPFDYQSVIESPDPTQYLPLLFSSKSYQSPQLVPAYIEAPGYLTRQVYFWLGLPPVAGASSPTVCFHYTTVQGKVYGFYEPIKGSWVESDMFASRPGVCVVVNKEGHLVEYPANTIVYTGSAPTGLVLSGDGSAVFINLAQGWKRHASGQTWETLDLFGAHMSTSFDGSNLCAHDYQGDSRIFCKLGEDDVFVTALRDDDYAARTLQSAVHGSTFFFVRGSRIYTVGYLRAPAILTTLASVGEGPFQGIWADVPVDAQVNPDAQAIWVSGGEASYMSNDGGWTWYRQAGCWAVGAGVFLREVKDVSSSVEVFFASTASFAEDVPYPLFLHNDGCLSSPPVWENWFQLKQDDHKFTSIQPEAKAATSPNGLFLYTLSPDGEVKLFLNVWNSPNFIKMSETRPDFAHARRLYCAKYGSIDRQCPQKKSGMPALAIILISLLGLGLLAYLFVGVSKPKALRTPSSPFSQFARSSAESTRPSARSFAESSAGSSTGSSARSSVSALPSPWYPTTRLES